MGNLVTLTYDSSVSIVNDINSSFDKATLRVCYVGDNRNMSSISKEVIVNCIDSIYNCPVVCNYDRETDSIGSHDISFVKIGDKYRVYNDTNPIGVVPHSANWWFETIEDKEYLCVDVLIWKRQDAYEHIKNNCITDESMEIEVVESHTNSDGRMIIDKFEFNAFCLLESAAPCYEGASLIMCDEKYGDGAGFFAAYNEMIDELKSAGREVFMSDETNINSTRKEEVGLEKKNEILAKFGLTAEDLGITNIEEFSEEEIEAKCEEFALTSKQLEEQIREALCGETYTDEWGTWNKYGYMDHDAGVVYAIDHTDCYKLYGLTYSMDGDNVVIDFESPVRKKISYVDFEEGDSGALGFESVAFDIANRASEIEKCEANKIAEEFEKKEQAFAEKEAQMSEKIEELVAFKEDVETKKHEAEVDSVFSQFEDLNDIKEFEELKSNYGEMSVEEIEEKCFSIRGRTMKFSQKSNKKTPVRIPAKEPQSEEEPYGGLFEYYK